MRLKKIKLAGFKSFVDPTTIQLMSNLVAVVGPNGCGKSNVIDAVRWVMGESSAKHLRGGSLTDVIFSGSTARKPVGQATVELLFDNAQGKLGGEYAKYAEIGIKRQVSRDGQSTYFLNGQRCRRKDVTDIFLGTGLGPRSYAIIEQGMISRVIDAKPEELRTFFEEAAGISKYKERRKETENRIRHTQDNLARLNDIRDELGNQLRHLQRQSQAAERYQALKAQERDTSAQLAGLAWRRLDQEVKEHENTIRVSLTKLEEQQAGTQQLKTQQEKLRLDQTEANETLNEVQKRFYSLGAQIAKIEQEISHQQDRYSQLQADKLEAEQTLATTVEQLQQDQVHSVQLQSLINELEPEHEIAVVAAENAIEIQQQAETMLEEWRDKSSQLQQSSLAPARQAESEKSKIAQLERQIHQTQERKLRLDNEQSQVQTQNETVEIDQYDEKIERIEDQIEEVANSLADCVAQKEHRVQELNQLRPRIKGLEQSINEALGQQTALQTLQASALGKNDEAKNAWVTKHGLNSECYLAQKIEVMAGYEVAVETVLGGFLEAIGVESGQLHTLAQDLDALAQMGVSLVEWKQINATQENNSHSLVNFLQNKDHLPESIYRLLAQVRVCVTLEEAIAMVPSLSANESVITQAGWWLGNGWVKIKAQSGAQESGVLQREERLKALTLVIEKSHEELNSLSEKLDECEENQQQIEQEKDSHSQQKNKLQQELVTLQSERKIKQNRIEQNQKRYLQIQQEIAECQNIIQNGQQEVNVSREQLQQALEKMAQCNQEQEELVDIKHRLQEEVSCARIKSKEAKERAHELAMTLQTYKTQIQSQLANIERLKIQIENAKNKVTNVELSLARSEEPIEPLKIELEQNLEKRIDIEQELNQTRDSVAQIDNLFREIEQKLNQHDRQANTLREQLENAKMAWQALSVHRENTLEKLKNTQMSLDEILANMPHDANEKEWQQMLIDIEQKIQRLGAINLAAIEEFAAANQRKEYLDSQCTDLTEGLTTLENAIKKIDKETRTKFKEVFDRVNGEFTQLFPKLFGGGQASLTMTGEDLLDTGISLMARPPGKKNSSIQLLSGGEKALTALALVFSIFQLNPAPFCMLDEVDAPLDENNVGRFCNLVKEMSKTVQFIYVSHNKVTMEMANQLQGVTMREPGVSRLVTVDIEEAKSMIE